MRSFSSSGKGSSSVTSSSSLATQVRSNNSKSGGGGLRMLDTVARSIHASLVLILILGKTSFITSSKFFVQKHFHSCMSKGRSDRQFTAELRGGEKVRSRSSMKSVSGK